MLKEKLYKAILVIFIVVAFLLRIIGLDSAPKGLQSDEASFLINAVSLSQTLKDEDNTFLPLTLKSLIDSKPALYSYLQIPFITVFGPSTAASRMPSAVIGTLSIYLFFVLLNKTFKNKRIAIIGALLLAVSPWHIMNSRATQEVILSFTLVLANLIFASDLFHKGVNKKNLVFFFLTALTAMYAYHSAKIILVLFYAVLFVLHFIRQKNKTNDTKIIAILTGITALCFVITAQSALTRFSAIGLLNDDLPKALIFEYTTKSTPYTPLLALRAFYNKPVMYFHFFIDTYLKHLDLNFLFTTGGATRRFIVPHHGLFYIFDLLLLPLGIFALIKKHQEYLIPWLLLLVISPIPAALTTEEIPSSIRAFTLILPLTVACAVGFDWILQNFNKRMQVVVSSLAFVVLIWSVGFFAQQFFVIMPIKNTLFRSRSYEVVSEMVANTHEQYDSVQFAGDLREMYIYLWQRNLISIEQIQSQPHARYLESYQLGKFYFTMQQCEFPDVLPNSLLVAPHDCAQDLSKIYSVVATADFDNGTPGFILLKTLPLVNTAK